MYCAVVIVNIMPVTISKPKYVQLAEQLRERIHNGELKVGDRLPSYAEMYRDHGATTATMKRVCDLLEQENLIERRSGSGLYVAEPHRAMTGNIGFIGGAHYNNPKLPFNQHLMSAMQRQVIAEGRHLLYLGSDKDWDASACDKVDGIIICNIEDTASVLRQLPPHLPRVSVLTIVDGITSVGVDDYRGAQMAVRYLLEQGHRRIACLMEKYPSDSRRRFSGYRDALIEAGIDAHSAWIRLTETLDAKKVKRFAAYPYREWGEEQMGQWLRKGWDKTGCTAILVQNEMAAIGVMRTLQKEGIQVPQDVSIITFDGTELCDLVSPRLTAVALPLEQIGVRAVEILSRQFAGEQISEQAFLLPLSLRAGESATSVSPVSKPASKVLLGCG